MNLLRTTIDERVGAGAIPEQNTFTAENVQDGGRADYGLNVPITTGIGNATSIGTGDVFNNQDVNALISGSAWNSDSLTFSFPTKASFYGANYGDQHEPSSGFTPFTAAQKEVVRFAFSLISEYTQLTFTEVKETSTNHADLRFAGSSVPPTSWAYYPWASKTGGDVWLGNVKNDAPTKAGYAFDTILHEIGHAMGLKHGHQDDGTHGVLAANHDSTEWSIMTYHSYVGADEFYNNLDGSGNQSYMMDDIAALQYLYGANYNSNSTATVYTWNTATGEMFINGSGQGASSANKIYETIWDGGGKDTYNLSNYSANLVVDLRPGFWSTFSTSQLADLDGTSPGLHLAHGNIANAHLFGGDKQSLIENATGGTGNDSLTGNVGNNLLDGGDGKDILSGGSGKDTLVGGAGADKLKGNAGADKFIFVALSESSGSGIDTIIGLQNADKIDLSAIDAISSTAGEDAFILVGSFTHHSGEAMLEYDAGHKRTVLSLDVNGDGVADAQVYITGDHHDFTNFVL